MTIARAVVAPTYGGPEVLEVREVEVPAPGAGEVTIEVRAAGLNPVDFKLFSGARGADPVALPLPVGLEVAGVLTAIGPDTEIASGGGEVGDEVLAFRVSGGFSSALTVPAGLPDWAFNIPDKIQPTAVRPEGIVKAPGSST